MRFALADRSHDSQLRAMAASEPMPGWVRLLFMREPSFFDGIGVQGHENQVIALFDGDDIVGMGCRSTRPVLIDGSVRRFGYLGGLRSIPRVGLARRLGRGYRFLRELHGDGRVPGYLTTIVEENRSAIDVLTSGRAGLPDYLPRGRYYSYAIPLKRGHGAPRGSVTICRGSAIGADSLAEFLSREGARKQFFPAFEAADFGQPHLRGLALDDFRVIAEGDTILGAVAVWDQRSFRQTVVSGYAPFLHAVRPVLNGPMRLAGYRGLPRPGQALNIGYLAFACVKDNSPDVFAALLHAVRAELSQSDLHFLCVGLHEDDALNVVLSGIRCLRYCSRLFIVCWDDTRSECESFMNNRVPYVEAATL